MPDTYQRILDYANRADPYPLYAQLRETPVARQDDGTYVVSTYWEITELLHDPRVSSEEMLRQQYPTVRRAFLNLDPPEHDRLRHAAMRPFGPPETPRRVTELRPELHRIISTLIDEFSGKQRLDLVEDFAYPFPVTVICRLLGVPREDEKRFHSWADEIIESLDPSPAEDPAQQQQRQLHALAELSGYLSDLIDSHRKQPGDDLLSGLVVRGDMDQQDLVSTARLLLIAGHETTVNLITNGMLTLLRHPDVLERLRREPDLAVGVVEELLRYEPPVQILPQRSALDDIDIAGTTIPHGAPIALLLASGSRDPDRFADPDRFDPDREDNQHLGFGGGIHYCFGAPLARLETQLALTELARRLPRPRLAEDPPPYRRNPVLRGPRHLPIELG